MYRATGGMLNLGIGQAELARRDLHERVQAPLRRPFRIAVACIKGGIGKTTLAACLGYTFAEIRGDQVCAIDANPDAGTLADRLTKDTHVTIRDLLRDIHLVDCHSQVTAYMGLAGRLRVLASDQNPAVSEALAAEEYDIVLELLLKFFNIVITDCGTGISHPTMDAALEEADALVVPASPTVDGASRAGHTLDWLERNGQAHLARNAVVVINHLHRSRDVDPERVAEHFQERVRAVVSMPYDPILAAGGRLDYSLLRTRTRDALTEICAHIADLFPRNLR